MWAKQVESLAESITDKHQAFHLAELLQAAGFQGTVVVHSLEQPNEVETMLELAQTVNGSVFIGLARTQNTWMAHIVHLNERTSYGYTSDQQSLKNEDITDQSMKHHSITLFIALPD